MKHTRLFSALTGLILAASAPKLASAQSNPDYVPYDKAYGARFEDTPRRLFDQTRSREVLDYETRVPLREGLVRTIEWARARRGQALQEQTEAAATPT